MKKLRKSLLAICLLTLAGCKGDGGSTSNTYTTATIDMCVNSGGQNCNAMVIWQLENSGIGEYPTVWYDNTNDLKPGKVPFRGQVYKGWAGMDSRTGHGIYHNLNYCSANMWGSLIYNTPIVLPGKAGLGCMLSLSLNNNQYYYSQQYGQYFTYNQYLESMKWNICNDLANGQFQDFTIQYYKIKLSGADVDYYCQGANYYSNRVMRNIPVGCFIQASTEDGTNPHCKKGYKCMARFDYPNSDVGLCAKGSSPFFSLPNNFEQYQ